MVKKIRKKIERNTTADCFCSTFHNFHRLSTRWVTLATVSEAESESEAQVALRSSVNQKSE